MGIKHILVVLEESQPALQRLEVAVHLAGQHGAALTGLCLISGAEKAVRIEAAFREQVGGAQIAGEWIAHSLSPSGAAQAVTAHAFFADLVVIGQPEEGQGTALGAEVGEQVLLNCGRPVLWIPYAGHFTPLGQRVVVAWKPGREAVRSVHDALPLLGRAQQVHVLTVNPGRDDERSGERLCEHLGRHGVGARFERQEGRVETGDLLLNRACEEGCDLMVLGAYGNARLGPVARHLLRFMTVPLFMSH